jgi:hypothetical protein
MVVRGIEIELRLGRTVPVVVSMQLREVMLLKGVGEFMEELDQYGGRLIGELGGQADERKIVRFKHWRGYFGLRAAARARALLAARSFASFRR